MFRIGMLRTAHPAMPFSRDLYRMKIYPHTPLLFLEMYGIISATLTTMGQVPERPIRMRIETETAVRSIVCIDTEVTREMLEKALDILRGKSPEEDVIVHNIRFSDAMEILMVSRRTLRHYLDSGYLDRVYGGGRRAIGVTRESLVRFMTRRTVAHKSSDGLVIRHGTACNTSERSWAKTTAK